MKNLAKYSEEIHKCSKCGLCQSVCPVYKVTGNDCSVSRGKFIMLNGIVKGDLKLNKNVNKYLDMCLKCNACKDFCPSDIDARKIFLTAKAQYFNKSASEKFFKILHSPVIFNFFLNCVKITTNTYRFLGVNVIIKVFYPLLQKFELGKKIILMNEFVNYHSPFTIHHSPKQQLLQATKVVYFKGCVNNYINPRTKIATENILKQMGINIVNAGFQCCGVPFLSGGNVEQFVKQAEFNLAQIPDDFDYFLTDCASCQNAFFEYENYIKDEKMLEKLKKINEKSINVVDFVVKNAKSFEFDVQAHQKQNLNLQSRLGLRISARVSKAKLIQARKMTLFRAADNPRQLTQQHQGINAFDAPQKISFTFHKPCHLEDLSFLQEFLAKAKNVEYVEMKDFDKCCGFSGEFALKNPEISQKISETKIQNALETGADYVLTSCPSCILGLTQGFINHSTVRQFDLSTFIEFLSNSKITT